jgi:asparagine synthase (glutamine-hydrolysing)
MCGINGIIGVEQEAESRIKIGLMNNQLAHRGPDDEGIFVQPGIALGHRRLSIIDLSAAGHQPMMSYDKRFILVFNGEIYNFKEVKERINQYQFSTNTDSEVILAAYDKWGTSCLQYLNGMFAFAIWDQLEKTLFIARDRLGVKPIYYYRSGKQLIFSSEIRPIIKCGLFTPTLNKAVLPEFLAYQTVHAPRTIINDIQMLMPGHYLLIKGNGEIIEKSYWNIIECSNKKSIGRSYKQICEDVYELLFKSVEKRMIADVPLGAFLSGGIDSSAVVALMSKIVPGKVKTFTITFNESEFNESKYADIIARKYHTEHTEIKLSPDFFLDELPNALKAMDHPSADGANTYVVSKATKEKGIAVALSGLGGDELFAGYSAFRRLKNLNNQNILKKISKPIRQFVGSTYAALIQGIEGQKLSEVLNLPSFELNLTYPITRRVFSNREIDLLLSKSDVSSYENELIPFNKNASHFPFLSQVSIAEINSYMQNILLRDTDQMSMRHALEIREPFLDYELVEYVLGVQDIYKDPIIPKKLLVDSLGDMLPPEIVHRKKMGFSFPWKYWLQHQLSTFCLEKLEAICARDFVNADELKKMQNAFFKGSKNVNWTRIWLFVVLENWMSENGIE